MKNHNLIFVILFLVMLTGICNINAQTSFVNSKIPVTGRSIPELQEFDTAVKLILSKTDAPGGVLAIAHNEKLVYARGFGYADQSTGEPVKAASLFRIASVSKPITAVAVLKLIEQNKLSLDQKIYPLLQIWPIDKDNIDPRIKDITIYDLLTHSGGWDREISFDPMFSPVAISVAMGETPPGSPEAIIRYMLNRPLDFEPGSRQVYSNFGYAILGRIIEKVTGNEYEDYVLNNVLKPLDADHTQLGKSLLKEKMRGEVRYHDSREFPSVFPGGGVVTAPYGAFSLELMDAHGGWVSTAPDLLRFLTAINGESNRPDILGSKYLKLMRNRPESASDSKEYYGMGLEIRLIEDNPVYIHMGDLPGSTALIACSGQTQYALLLNGNAGSRENTNMLLRTLLNAAQEIDHWPENDLFPNFK